MKFVLDGKTYDAESVTKLSLMDILKFNAEAQAGAWGIAWADVEGMLGQIQGLDDEERRRHPGSLWVLALTIWRARRSAGEDLTFEEAIDGIPVLDSTRLRFLPDPADRKPKAKGSRPDPR